MVHGTQQSRMTPQARETSRAANLLVFEVRYAAQPSNRGSKDKTAAFAIRMTPQRNPYAAQSRLRTEPAIRSVAHNAVAPSRAGSEVSQRLWKLSRIAFGNIDHSQAAPAPRPVPPIRLPV